jgi:hypothetical protein
MRSHASGTSHRIALLRRRSRIDAVIPPCCSWSSGRITDPEKDLETAAFNVFLYGRMIEAAAEIDDHLNRGRNMDTRTPLEQCAFVV